MKHCILVSTFFIKIRTQRTVGGYQFSPLTHLISIFHHKNNQFHHVSSHLQKTSYSTCDKLREMIGTYYCKCTIVWWICKYHIACDSIPDSPGLPALCWLNYSHIVFFSLCFWCSRFVSMYESKQQAGRKHKKYLRKHSVYFGIH